MNEREKLQLLMISVMTQAFSDFSGRVSELLEEVDADEFSEDPYGIALQVMETGFESFKENFQQLKEEGMSADVQLSITEKVMDEFEAFIDTEYGEFNKKPKGEDDGFH